MSRGSLASKLKTIFSIRVLRLKAAIYLYLAPQFFEKKTVGLFFCVQEGMRKIPRFTGNPVDQAFERLRTRVPGFEPDPPEIEIIQRELDKARIRKVKKGDTDHVL